MKILHVIPSVAAVRGGPSQAVLEMVKALNVLGDASEDERKVTAAVGRIRYEIATTNDNGKDLLNVSLEDWTEYAGVPIRFFPRFSPSVHGIREFAFSSSFTAWLWQHVTDYDLLHIHAIFSYPSTIAMAIARMKGVPYINRPLGQLCAWSLQQSRFKKQIYLSAIERSNLKHCRALHLTSLQEQQEVSALGLSLPSFILPHGISIPPPLIVARSQLRQLLGISADTPIILFMSRLHAKKGLNYLIPALGKCMNLTEYPFWFILAGQGDPAYEAEVKDLLREHGLDRCTHWAGFVTGDRKQLFLQGSDLFALTSHSENFGIVVLEAMAAGLPILTTPGVALAAEVEQYQLGIVSALDIDGIATAIADFLEQPQAFKQMGDRASQLVASQYSWDTIATKLAEVYSRILTP
ncbi:glycosyltransferase [Tumidithrix helvetica PCC 7403]|uniref:glycosyltransferase n=1 Tax=Tumidithrix helvetica TaxID=3457545 RepID=UPI003CC04A66